MKKEKGGPGHRESMYRESCQCWYHAQRRGRGAVDGMQRRGGVEERNNKSVGSVNEVKQLRPVLPCIAVASEVTTRRTKGSVTSITG